MPHPLSEKAVSNMDWLTAVNTNHAISARRTQLVGRNSAVGAGAMEDIWIAGGIYPFQTAALPLRIRAGGDPGDVAGGAGARLILISGLDANFDPITETLVPLGALVSAATVQSFIRVNRVVVVQSGTYGGSNLAAMLIENTAGTLLAEIETQFGITQLGIFSLERNALLWWTAISINVDSNQAANIQTHVRLGANQVAAPFGPPIVREFDGVDGILQATLQSWTGPFAGPADMWFSAQATGGGGTSVTCQAEFYIEDVDP